MKAIMPVEDLELPEELETLRTLQRPRRPWLNRDERICYADLRRELGLE